MSSSADNQETPSPDLVWEPDSAVGQKSAALEDAPFWSEVAAFNQFPQSLIDQYYGQYVAVYHGNIVDSDVEEAELALRFYRTFGYVPVYIHKVGTEEGLVDADEGQSG